MNELKSTSKLVMRILQNDKMARNSDNYLYYKVLSYIGQENGINIDKMSTTTFLLHMKEFGFPGFETVRRTRQKIQHDFPELASAEDVEVLRAVNETVYRDYALGGCV